MKTYYTELTLPVSGMSCTACASSVESVLKSQSGVISAEVNYATSSVRIKFDPMAADLFQLQQALKPIGYDLVTTTQNSSEVFGDLEEIRYKLLKNKLIVAIIFSLPVFFISMIWHHTSQLMQYMLLALSLPVIFYSGRDFYLTAFRLARIGKTNMDTLVALGTSAAFILSLINTIAPRLLGASGITGYVYYESAVVIITLILLGRFLEERSRNKASAAIKSLMSLQPDIVIRINDEQQETISINELMPGDTVLIKPGNTIPVDGIITKGNSWIDESMMSGEPEPVYRQLDDQVLAGTLNSKGALEVKTLKTGASTTLSRIIAMVQEAQNSKPPVQLLVDKISAVFVPVVILISLITFAGWFFVFPEQPAAYAIVTSISVLIIACPCALGLATPTALIAAIGHGAKKGILFRDATGIESAGKTNTLLIDKTGTLTLGKPALSKVHFTDKKDEKRTKQIFAGLTSLSAHPLSLAVSRKLYDNEDIKLNIEEFSDLPGKGITGTIDDVRYYAGSPSLLDEAGIKADAESRSLIEQMTSEGSSIVILTSDTGILAIAVLQDALRQDAAVAVGTLRKMGIEVHMLTGDNAKSAERVARLTGIKHFRAGMSPLDKADYVDEIRKKGKKVCMAGDGINDTIALARADVGMAMGSGSDASREVAAITLTGHNLMQVADAIKLSRKTNRIIKENLIWAFGYNVIAIPVAAGLLFPLAGVLLNPMIASAAMAFSSVSVVLNSLRLR
ncbi:MAG: heavy metal translocating P-type ATPase [Lentimicrobium sp.]|nr:heavy metal translocating P-type ATPase [Lentimicrobium sp.]